MKISETIYSAFTLVFAFFCFIGIIMFQVLIIPRADNPDVIPVFHFTSIILGLYAIALSLPAILNLKNKKLGTTSTIIQIIVLMFMMYGIPFGIWGIILLVKSNKIANQNAESIVTTPIDKSEPQSTQTHV